MTRLSRLARTTAGLAAAAVLIAAPTAAHGPAPSERAQISGLRPPESVTLASDATVLKVTPTPVGPPPASSQAVARKTAAADPSPRPGNAGEDEEGAENANPTSSKPLEYRGGDLQTAPRIYLVLWGSGWFPAPDSKGLPPGDPYGVAERLDAMYRGIGGSRWAGVMQQYKGDFGTFANPTGEYQGWTEDTTPVPLRPTHEDMRQAALRAAQRMNDAGLNTQYVIALPYKVIDQSSATNHYCAWHAWARGSLPAPITYTSLPYIPWVDHALFNCGGRAVNGDDGVLDGVTLAAGHEYAESVNDPLFAGFADADGSENGDKCEYRNLGNVRLANGLVFPMQPTWSNSSRTAKGNGCLLP